MGRGKGGLPGPMSSFEKGLYFVVMAAVVIAVIIACM